MTDGTEGLTHTMPGHARYLIDVPGVAHAGALSVVSCTVREQVGELFSASITLTHPERLAREDYLGRAATFTIAPQDGEPQRFHGFIADFRHTKTTPDECTYIFTIKPLAARLTLTHSFRVFQGKTGPQMIEQLLRKHDLRGGDFSFRLRRHYPEHAFRLQYNCTDWAYVRILMEQEGIYCYRVAGDQGDTLVFADDVDHYVYQPTLALPYREVAGLNAAEDAILSLAMHAQTVPKSYLVADYNPDQAWERFRAEANIACQDSTTYGQPYLYGTGHLDQAQAQWEAQLRHEAAIATQIQYHGQATEPALHPMRVIQTDVDLPDAPHGLLITEVTHTGARDQAYTNTFTAIPADRRYRLPLNETSWPKIPGTLSARVTSSPGNTKYAYLTDRGLYRVRFDLDFDPSWPQGGESVPLRLAKPFAGKLQTGMHFPAHVNDEATIEFYGGDPNRPYISGFQHHSQATDLITHRERWMSRNVIRTQADNKLQMEDWEGQEHVKLSTEHSGKSQLTLGHIVDGQRQKRGEGAELRTSGWMALRGGKGVFLSADDQPASGQQLAMDNAIGLLQQALLQSEALGEAAKAAQAIAADHDRQKALLDNTLHQLKQAGILVSAPAGMALASGSDLQLTASKNLIATASNHTDISAMKRFTLAAGELVSIFAQKLGIKLFAARGKVEIQAQSDAMQLLADQDVTVTSTKGRIVIEAKTELILKCGGSYLRLSSTGIEDGTRGDRTVKAAAFSRQGPAALSAEMNQWSNMPFDERVKLVTRTGEPAPNQQYELYREDGAVIRGVTDAQGWTTLQKGLGLDGVKIKWLGKA